MSCRVRGLCQILPPLIRFTNTKTCPQIYKTQRHSTITLSFFHILITSTKTWFKIPSTNPKSLHALIKIYRPKQTQMANNSNKSGGRHFYTIQDIFFFIDLKISNFFKISQMQREREKLCERVWVRDGEKHTTEKTLHIHPQSAYLVGSPFIRISGHHFRRSLSPGTNFLSLKWKMYCWVCLHLLIMCLSLCVCILSRPIRSLGTNRSQHLSNPNQADLSLSNYGLV